MKKKHYLIIGGTKGIGKTLVRIVEKDGHTVSVIGRHPLNGIKTSKRVAYFRLDLLHTPTITQVLNKIIKHNGRINHIIFCQRFRGDTDDWKGEFDVSLTATKQIIEHVIPHFDNSEEKSIVIIGSIANTFIGLEQPLSYHVSKAGLLQLARYFAVTLGPKGIRVNSISPSTVLKDESKEYYLHNTKLQHLYKQIIPIGRMGTAQDIANIAYFLCDLRSSFITGQNIIADGGLSLQSQEAVARSISSLQHPNFHKQVK